MKKIILSFFAFMLTAIICNAAPINVNTAQTVTSNFYSSNSNKEITSIALAFTETASDGSAAWYVFNINSNDGFVIISADDAAKPVIGYATTGHYEASKVIPPLIMWLKKRTNEISYIKSNHLVATQDIKQQWQAIQNNSGARFTVNTDSVGPLCTVLWGQDDPKCPGATAGCTATAMAQIMKYWNYPPHGFGSVTYDDTTSLGFTNDYGKETADFGNITYDWMAMDTNYTGVEILMYDCAVSVYTDFNPFGSSANVMPYDSLAWQDPYGGKVCAQQAYSKYFGYDSASMQGLQQSAYTAGAWDSILVSELNNGRVIQYAGYTDDTKTEGHTWVCDGYDGNNNFHMNWGWNGDYDGYYSIGNLFAGGYDLDADDEALIGIQPPPTIPTGIKESSLSNSVSIYPNPTNGMVTLSSTQLTLANIEVFNMLGEVVLQLPNQQINKSAIDLSSQPAGIYFIRLQSGGEIFNTKLIKE